MRLSPVSLSLAGLAVSAYALAGCGGYQPPIGEPGTVPQSYAIATHAERGKSWMLPEAKAQDLLYVSRNSPGEISVYSYPKGKLMGNLTVAGAFGLCTDAKGDIFAISTEKPGDLRICTWWHEADRYALR